jgi:hypothetical protein
VSNEEELNNYLAVSGTPATEATGTEADAQQVATAIAMANAGITELRAHFADVLSELGGLRTQVTNLDRHAAQTSALAQQVAELATALDELASDDEGKKNPKPIDLAHITPADRTTIITNLADWLNTVVFTGWPWTQDQIRPCWPHHPDLINDLLLLKTTYEAAYQAGNRRAHHAADFRHLLDYITATCEERTRTCPADHGQHPVPLPARVDAPAAATAARHMQLAEVWTLTDHAKTAHQTGAHTAAQEARDRATALIDAYKITEAEYQAYQQHVRATRAQQTRQSASKDD